MVALTFSSVRNNIFVTTMIKFVSVIVLTNIIHYTLIHAYSQMCSKYFFYSFFNFGSPVCQFMNYLQFEISKHYITIWSNTAVGFSVWMMSKLAYQNPGASWLPLLYYFINYVLNIPRRRLTFRMRLSFLGASPGRIAGRPRRRRLDLKLPLMNLLNFLYTFRLLLLTFGTISFTLVGVRSPNRDMNDLISLDLNKGWTFCPL